MTIVDSREMVETTLLELQKFLDSIRVQATPQALVRQDKNVFNDIRQYSRDADLVFLGIRHPQPGESIESYAEYYAELLKNTTDLPAVAMAMAAEDLDFDSIFTETSFTQH